MTAKPDYRRTLRACYLGYVTQAICANFAPLLFLTFQKTYGISLGEIALIPSVFFLTQLLVDFAAAEFVDRIGYRTCVVVSHILSAAGLGMLAFLPDLLPSPFAGILISVMVYAVSSGLIEVLVSPIVEACPFENKESRMSLLHSFYCWGVVAVVLGSTLFFALFGLERWRILTLLWALVPLYNIFNFLTCPIERLVEKGDGLGVKNLLRLPVFWLLDSPYGLLRRGGKCNDPVGVRLCRSGHRPSQDAGGSGGTLPLCGVYGPVPGALCRNEPQHGTPQTDAGVRRPVRCGLSAGIPDAGARPGSGGLRPVRLLRGHHVAGHHQHCFPHLPRGRYRYVCLSGAGR